uniref:Type II toxin-antitoxin system HicB family antitoxin n=1 Tax=Schlesneria paludicola TaxID=360056 RepID=A0A7C2K0L0_9PLAN
MKPTLHEDRGYVFRIEYSPEAETAWVVEFPDFSEIITSGNSLQDAFAQACEALDLHLESLQKLGKRLPRAKAQLALTQ